MHSVTKKLALLLLTANSEEFSNKLEELSIIIDPVIPSEQEVICQIV